MKNTIPVEEYLATWKLSDMWKNGQTYQDAIIMIHNIAHAEGVILDGKVANYLISRAVCIIRDAIADGQISEIDHANEWHCNELKLYDYIDVAEYVEYMKLLNAEYDEK